MWIEYLFDRCEEVVRFEECGERVHGLFGLLMKVDQFLDVDIVGLRDDFVAFACEEGEEGEGAGLVFVPAGVSSFEADVGAGGPAFWIDADLFGLLVVHAGHMFHFIKAEDYDQLRIAH